MDAFLGKWKADRSRDVNYTAFLKASGIPSDTVEKISKGAITFELSKQGNKYTSVIYNEGLPEKTNVFEVGKQAEVEMPAGMKMKVDFTIDGNKLTEHCKTDQGVEFDNIREIIGNEMKVSTVSPAGTMEQYFVRC